MHSKSNGAFSLIELIAATAIIAILSSILIPTAAAAHRSSTVARTKIQWSQWAAALEAFRLEYGAYPDLPSSGKVNAAAGTDASTEHPFNDVLTGHRRNGTLSGTGDAFAAQNSRHIRFIDFVERDWGGPSGTLLCDAFGTTDIAVVLDRNGDGLIDASDCNPFPAVYAEGSPIALRPGSAELGPNGIRAGAIFYSASPGATDSSSLVMSWR